MLQSIRVCYRVSASEGPRVPLSFQPLFSPVHGRAGAPSSETSSSPSPPFSRFSFCPPSSSASPSSSGALKPSTLLLVCSRVQWVARRGVGSRFWRWKQVSLPRDDTQIIHTCKHSRMNKIHEWIKAQKLRACMRMCTQNCMHAHVYANACMRMCTQMHGVHMRMHVVHACVHKCMHVFMHTCNQPFILLRTPTQMPHRRTNTQKHPVSLSFSLPFPSPLPAPPPPLSLSASLSHTSGTSKTAAAPAPAPATVASAERATVTRIGTSRRPTTTATFFPTVEVKSVVGGRQSHP